MRNQILHTASDMFLNLGVKTVTMDDIANQMGISKKTIYEFYTNKNELVEATTDFLFDKISSKIDVICCKDCNYSPIESLFEINNFLNEHLKEDLAPEYQLKKYFPQVYNNLQKKKFDLIVSGITENLTKGIELGLYRETLKIDVVARFYYGGLSVIKDEQIFDLNQYKISELINTYLIYHLRAICTPKGLQELEKFIKKND